MRKETEILINRRLKVCDEAYEVACELKRKLTGLGEAIITYAPELCDSVIVNNLFDVEDAVTEWIDEILIDKGQTIEIKRRFEGDFSGG